MNRFIPVFLLMASFAAISAQDDGMKEFNSAIINAKFAGACGVYKQMSDFQAVTQMPGGDDFVNRFGSTEVARLGMTIKDFTDLCSKAIEQYNTMSKMSQ